MEDSYLDSFINFCFKFLKFALLIFTGAFIIVGTLWILFAILEWLYIGASYLKDMMSGNIDHRTSNYALINKGNTKCPNCHLVTPCGPRCSTCGTSLPDTQKLIGRNTSPATEEDLDSADISVAQYSERKKYQKIKCPYCNALSNVIEEKYHGSQTRECRNGHIFVYDYESELLIQDELNAKYQ